MAEYDILTAHYVSPSMISQGRPHFTGTFIVCSYDKPEELSKTRRSQVCGVFVWGIEGRFIVQALKD